jgi:lysine 6-dehydrogenase
VVLGGGRVGAAIVRDLTATDDFHVTVADVDPVTVERLLEDGADGMCLDLSEPANIHRAIAGADLVVGAVPGFMGYRTVERVLNAGKPMVDISFFPEDAFTLSAKAEKAGVPCLVDCGIAPGLSNLVLGRLEAVLDTTDSFRCLVGGLPVERNWPWDYKAFWSPTDVLEEYTRPARFRRDGCEVVVPALSDVELIHFPGVGTLEAFATDGLRSLLRTSRTPNMIEKTLRYPGHADLMRIFRDAGFFRKTPVQAASGQVIPLDVTSALLFDQWQFEEGEPDMTVMRMEIEGTKDGRRVLHVYNVLDHYHPETETSSMARTTGYMCTALVGVVASGLWTEPGVAAPEKVGARENCFHAVMKHLEEREVHVFHHRQER